jgi:hypothetical protein
MDMFAQALVMLNSLGTNLGVDLEPDAQGACALRIDDALDVTLRYQPSPPALLAYSPVGALPPGSVEGVLRRLLEDNHVWDGSRGATWSLSGEDVTLGRLFPLQGLEVEMLAAELAAFIAVALAGQATLAAPARQPPAPMPMPMPGMLPAGVFAP